TNVAASRSSAAGPGLGGARSRAAGAWPARGRATPATARSPARTFRRRRSSSAWSDALPPSIAGSRVARRVPDVVGIIYAAPEAQDRPDVPGEGPRVAEVLELHPTPRAERRDGLIVNESPGPGAVESGQDRPLLADGDALVERPELVEDLS